MKWIALLFATGAVVFTPVSFLLFQGDPWPQKTTVFLAMLVLWYLLARWCVVVLFQLGIPDSGEQIRKRIATIFLAVACISGYAYAFTSFVNDANQIPDWLPATGSESAIIVQILFCFCISSLVTAYACISYDMATRSNAPKTESHGGG